jgi:methylenetetrahydrofolate dehydrogenase (NADP+)/methenyltetrahydrofolate cyclohydrolase
MLVSGQKIKNRIKEHLKHLALSSSSKSLAIFYIGQNEVISKYVDLKKSLGKEIGVSVDILRFDEKIPEDDLLDEISLANKKYSGIIVQLPLPKHLNENKILNAIDKNLDVDMLTSESLEDFKNGKTKKLPPVVSAVKEILEETKTSLKGKKILVVGSGRLVGGPIALWLSREGISFDVSDLSTNNLYERLLDADIIISGAGVPLLIKPEMIKEGVVLIDAGTSTSNGKILGDIDPLCQTKASIASLVPGGVGPVTVVSLFRNLFADDN